MKVLFQSRSTLFSVPGGDTIQMMKTREYLGRHGVSVDISTELEPDLSGYDLVHLFNLVRPQELYLQALNAKRQGKLLALSTIFVSYAEYECKVRGGLAGILARRLDPGRLEYLKIAARALRNGELSKGTGLLLWNGYGQLQEKILAMADVLLPNSHSELERVIRRFPAAAAKRSAVVPNAVDRELFCQRPGELPAELERFRGCVLCVARIEGLKNQLNLVRAMRPLPWQLVLIGKPSQNYTAYLERIRREAGPRVHVLGEVEHQLLPHYYRAARVHVLASWMETTGLSSLEAGAAGCRLVITDRGDTRDYFRNQAWYCEPDSVDSIRAAIVSAYQAPDNAALAERIRDHYTWEKTAESTLEGYVLAGIGGVRGARPKGVNREEKAA